jgi:hypothetical protein
LKKGLILWARTDCIDDEAERHGAVLDAVQHGFSEIVIRREDARMASSANFIPVFIEGGNVTIDGRRAGRFISIHEADDMPAESEIDGDYLVVETADWKVIPLENLIAQCSSRNVRVIASVASSDEARLFAGTLEKGVDGIMISAASDSLAEVAARTQRLCFDSLTGQSDLLPGPTELLCAASAACLLRNVERFSQILPFSQHGASISVSAKLKSARRCSRALTTSCASSPRSPRSESRCSSATLSGTAPSTTRLPRPVRSTAG